MGYMYMGYKIWMRFIMRYKKAPWIINKSSPEASEDSHIWVQQKSNQSTLTLLRYTLPPTLYFECSKWVKMGAVLTNCSNVSEYPKRGNANLVYVWPLLAHWVLNKTWFDVVWMEEVSTNKSSWTNCLDCFHPRTVDIILHPTVRGEAFTSWKPWIRLKVLSAAFPTYHISTFLINSVSTTR